MTELLLVKLQVMFSIFINEKLERGFHYKFFVSFQWSYYLEELKANCLLSGLPDWKQPIKVFHEGWCTKNCREKCRCRI